MSYSLFLAAKSEPLNILGVQFCFLAIEPDVLVLVTDQHTAMMFVDQAVKFNYISSQEERNLRQEIRRSGMALNMREIVANLRLRPPVRAHRHYHATLCDCGHPIRHVKVYIVKTGVLWRTYRSTGTFLEEMYHRSLNDPDITPGLLDLTTQILSCNLPDVECDILPRLDGYRDEEKVRLVVPYCLLAPGVDAIMNQPVPKDRRQMH